MLNCYQTHFCGGACWSGYETSGLPKREVLYRLCFRVGTQSIPMLETNTLGGDLERAACFAAGSLTFQSWKVIENEAMLTETHCTPSPLSVVERG